MLVQEFEGGLADGDGICAGPIVGGADGECQSLGDERIGWMLSGIINNPLADNDSPIGQLLEELVLVCGLRQLRRRNKRGDRKRRWVGLDWIGVGLNLPRLRPTVIAKTVEITVAGNARNPCLKVGTDAWVAENGEVGGEADA